jgi:Dockerin type I domain
VNFAASSVGDFNDDGIVNQSDYVLWRASFGSSTTLNADANGNRQIDAADYVMWRNVSNAPSNAFATTSIGSQAPINTINSDGVPSVLIGAAGNKFQVTEDSGSGAHSEHAISVNLPTASSLQVSLPSVTVHQCRPKRMTGAIVDQVIVFIGKD